MAKKNSKELKSDLVLREWISLWKACQMSEDHKDWSRSVLIEAISKASGVSVDDVKDRISQNHRYARNKLIVAYVTRHYNNSKEGDLQVSRLAVQQDLQKRLKLEGLAFAVSINKGSIKCGKVDGWNLPPSSNSRGAIGVDWIGDFDGLF